MKKLLGISLALVMLVGSTPLGFSEPLRVQLENSTNAENLYCDNDSHVVALRTNGNYACVSERTIEKTGWEIIETIPKDKTPNDNSVVLNYSSLIELADKKEISGFIDLSQFQIEISQQITKSRGGNYLGGISEGISRSPSASLNEPSTLFGYADFSSISNLDYSTTNIQVANVDEPDYVKNNGEYIFIANDNTVTIIDATSPRDPNISDQFSIVWTTDGHDFTNNGILDIFLNNDKLIIFLEKLNETGIIIMDITSKDSPELYNNLIVQGNFQTARMIDEHIYLVTSHPLNSETEFIIPTITQGQMNPDDQPQIMRNEKSKVFAFPSNTLNEYVYKTVTSFDISGNNANSVSYLMGEENTIYVSPNSLYITYEDTTSQIINYFDWQYVDSIFPYLNVSDQLKIRELLLENPQNTLQKQEKWEEILDALEDAFDNLNRTQLEKIRLDLKIKQTDNNIPQTVIQKIDIDNGKFAHTATAIVLGTILNQFSMDEYDNQFRIATTSLQDRIGTSNNIFVFDINDSGLELVGNLGGIALNEDIYSARFTGDTLYLVTFRQIDPFFVIDMSNDQPKILGELKIPGFSNYLHPFGKDHVIGIGRDGGVKIALFDVSDFENPKIAGQVFIGNNQDTYTEAEENHKSVLIDFNKQLLSIPIIDFNNNGNFGPKDHWYGFYVYKINEQGFSPKGTVEIRNDEYYDGRSLYIGDTLFSISPEMISINDLNTLEQIKRINLN